MEVKLPTTYEQQIEKLGARGCYIGDKDECATILKNVNYYRLTAYFLPFKQPDGKYLADTSLDRVYSIYEFDRRMRRVIFSAIEKIEIKLRTNLAYTHAHKYGALGFEDTRNFNKRHNHEKMMEKLNVEIANNSKLLYVNHHIKNYEGKFPIWVAIELFTMGMLSYFYADLKNIDQRTVANESFGVSADELKSWLRCCTDLRNICAHYGRLYYRIFPGIPKTPENHFVLKNTLFDQIVMLKYLYPNRGRWEDEVLIDLTALVEEYQDSIKLNHIGFPDNWISLLEYSGARA